MAWALPDPDQQYFSLFFLGSPWPFFCCCVQSPALPRPKKTLSDASEAAEAPASLFPAAELDVWCKVGEMHPTCNSNSMAVAAIMAKLAVSTTSLARIDISDG